MNRYIRLLSTAIVLFIILCQAAYTQWSKAERDSLHKLSRQDHQLMMKKLGITELRPGPSGDPNAPNAANDDESKAKTYDSLPDPLTFNDGKAAIVAMAYEPRIAIGFIGSAGAGGTSILRRNFGEQVENLASSAEYHWFAPNFIKYAGPLTANNLPVDAHELVALCAPRPVFISAGASDVEGAWVDAKGMFLAGVHAGPVYELLGKKGLRVKEFPPQGTNLTEGEIAFRQHAGGHTVTPNWPYFIEFASRYFEK